MTRTVSGRRQRVLLVVTLVAALMAIGGLVGATLVKSPAQLAAETKPPTPSLLTAPAVDEVVQSTVVLRGTVVAQHRYPISLTAEDGAQRLVVTGTYKRVGAEVEPGDVILEVSGRPLIALRGKFPAYRDMQPGDTGKDVAELQAALRGLGYSSPGDASGYFGPSTKQAVRGLYAHLGYTVPTTGSSSEQQVRTAETAVVQAQRSLDELEVEARATTITAGQSSGHASTSRQASSPTASGSSSAGSGGVSLATQISWSEQDLSMARQEYAATVSQTGPTVPLNEIVFIPSFPAVVADSSAEVGNAVQSPVVTLTTGQLVIQGQLDPSEAGLVRAGMTVLVDDEATGSEGRGVVSRINAQVSPSAPGSRPYVPLTVAPSKALASASLGQDVRLTVVSASSAGKVLAVPEAAISVRADGRDYVSVVSAKSKPVAIPVKAGISGGGLVAVSPLEGGLHVGDQVVTGT